MKRLLTLILTLAMLASLAVPFAAFATEPEAGAVTYPDLTESEYNSLYVTDGLVFMLDFYRTNSYWREEGVTYAVPVGPSENTAYWYDADKDGIKDDGETVDLTKAQNRATWRVLVKRGTSYTYYEPTAAKIYNGTSSPVTEYATKEQAAAAATAAKEAINAAIAAHNADPANTTKLTASDYDCVVWEGASNALIAANKEWIAADLAFFADFTSVTAEEGGIYAVSYNPSLAAGRTDFDNNSKRLFTTVTIGDGYALMRNDYHSSGGLLVGRATGKMQSTTALQLVTLLGE